MTVRLRDDGRFSDMREQTGAFVVDDAPNTTAPVESQITDSRDSQDLACYWDGTGGTPATDSATLQLWVKDGASGTWVFVEEKTGVLRQTLQIFNCYGHSQCFVRFSAKTGTPTNCFVRGYAVHTL